ncbi:MAG: site-specific integrase [Bdellovibrionales bacterium]|nr:site-specific integrase [Bdellovibrionales bacterium]
MGYLEGTGKSLNTIQSYRSDLAAFEAFLTGRGRAGIRLAQLEPAILKEYLGALKAGGMRTNTRRRKVLTAHRFLRYLVGRNRLGAELGVKLPAPHKVERVPKVTPIERLRAAVLSLEPANPLQRRNRLLLRTLLESGCTVSEAARLSFADLDPSGSNASILFRGKAERRVPVPLELCREAEQLRVETGAAASAPLFTGFSKVGPLPGAITPRGVELLVEAHRARFGMPELTPRSFRHSRVLSWHREGVSRAEIQRRLGLKTEYAFRIYAPLLQADAPASSDPA